MKEKRKLRAARGSGISMHCESCDKVMVPNFPRAARARSIKKGDHNLHDQHGRITHFRRNSRRASPVKRIDGIDEHKAIT